MSPPSSHPTPHTVHPKQPPPRMLEFVVHVVDVEWIFTHVIQCPTQPKRTNNTNQATKQPSNQTSKQPTNQATNNQHSEATLAQVATVVQDSLCQLDLGVWVERRVSRRPTMSFLVLLIRVHGPVVHNLCDVVFEYSSSSRGVGSSVQHCGHGGCFAGGSCAQ